MAHSVVANVAATLLAFSVIIFRSVTQAGLCTFHPARWHSALQYHSFLHAEQRLVAPGPLQKPQFLAIVQN